ncbi:MAG: 2Fe-2S iron-sulfur cluster binding domain-containing protein [Zetaproteobacteria bacterium]|nr:2Fe-2S iron-sulfur cluster binding domain-containing protein [Zetaproteobacteria bacterium]
MIWNPFKSKGPTLTFLPDNRTVTVKPETTVLQAAIDHNINLRHACDGNLACSTCHIYIHDGGEYLPEPSLEEEDRLESADSPQACSRLACQVRVIHDLVIEIPPSHIA